MPEITNHEAARKIAEYAQHHDGIWLDATTFIPSDVLVRAVEQYVTNEVERQLHGTDRPMTIVRGILSMSSHEMESTDGPGR